MGDGLELIEAPLPDILEVPLNQHIGAPAEALVRIGESVDKGQPLAATTAGKLGARIHAPTSGQITAYTNVDIPGKGQSPCISIRADGKDRAWSGYATSDNPLSQTPNALRAAIIDAGIVGLGGAMFPAGVKLNPGSGITTLILNGAECEPQINCDDALMRQHALDILLGGQIMLRILAADECVVAVKASTTTNDSSPARDAMRAALAELDDDRIRIETVSAIYPVGGEAQLIQLLTGREIPAGGLPWDTGVACQNVGTAAAINRFFKTGEPLLSRIVTVTGQGVRQPVNVLARIGTPVAVLIECAGGYTESAQRLILGGPMMGLAATTDAIPVTKANNCVYVAGAGETSVPGTEMPCIRCGECARVCPASLTPQILLEARRSSDLGNLEHLGLMACIECGCCDYVCPSHIPLTRYFHRSKQELWQQRGALRRAHHAEQRHSARSARLEQQAVEQAAALEKQISNLKYSSGGEALDELKRRLDSQQSSDDQP